MQNYKKYFRDLYIHKGMAQEHRLTTDWEIYWKSKYIELTNKLRLTYNL